MSSTLMVTKHAFHHTALAAAEVMPAAAALFFPAVVAVALAIGLDSRVGSASAKLGLKLLVCGPLSVIACPPGSAVTSSSWPRGRVVVLRAKTRGVRWLVEEPSTRSEPSGASDRRVPCRVMAGPPGERVFPSTTYSDLRFAVRVEGPSVMTGGATVARTECADNGVVWPLITSAEAKGARLMVDPWTVISCPG